MNRNKPVPIKDKRVDKKIGDKLEERKEERETKVPWYRQPKNIIILILILLLLTLAGFAYINYRNLVVYQKDGSYSDSSGTPKYYLHIEYSTRKAFLPHEPINVEVKLFVVDKYLIRLFNSSTDIMILFGDSYKTKNSINKNNKLAGQSEKKDISDGFSYIRGSSESNGLIKLKREDPNINGGFENIYSGKGQMYFVNEGNFGFMVNADSTTIKIDDLNDQIFNIKIGSSTELLGMKTNDLLFVLTVVGLFISLVGLVLQLFSNRNQSPK